MMVAKHPELKGGAPYIIQGMMFLNAPMPVRSVKKAKECFQSAHRVRDVKVGASDGVRVCISCSQFVTLDPQGCLR
jgi:hypothetical protein